jgi:hypothetical protein
MVRQAAAKLGTSSRQPAQAFVENVLARLCLIVRRLVVRRLVVLRTVAASHYRLQAILIESYID